MPLISLSLHPFPRPILSFFFLPRRKLFTRRIFVARDEPAGYLVSIDRSWNHAKSFRPSSRGLLLSVSPSFYFLFSFLTPFTHRPHFFYNPKRTAITGVFSSFVVPMRSLCHLALYLTDALFSPLLPSLFFSLSPLLSCNFVSRNLYISFSPIKSAVLFVNECSRKISN